MEQIIEQIRVILQKVIKTVDWNKYQSTKVLVGYLEKILNQFQITYAVKTATIQSTIRTTTSAQETTSLTMMLSDYCVNLMFSKTREQEKINIELYLEDPSTGEVKFSIQNTAQYKKWERGVDPIVYAKAVVKHGINDLGYKKMLSLKQDNPDNPELQQIAEAYINSYVSLNQLKKYGLEH